MSAMGDRRQSDAGKRRRFGTTSQGVADWQSGDADIIKRVIVAAGTAGCAIRFGYSKDGGAYAIGIYEPEDAYTVWWTPHTDVDKNLLDLEQYFTDLADSPVSEPKPKNKR